MPKKLDHMQLRSKYTPWLAGEGDRQQNSEEALEELCSDKQSILEQIIYINYISVVCQVKEEHVLKQDVVYRRVGTSVNP